MTKLIHLQMFWRKSRQSRPKSITNHQRNFQVLMTQLFKPMSNLASVKIENASTPSVNKYNLKPLQRFATKWNRGSNDRGKGSRSPLMGYISHSKCCLKSIFQKKLQIFSMRGLLPWRFVYWNGHILRNLSCPEYCTAWKMSKYGVFFWSLFSCIRTEYGNDSINLRIQSKHKKLQTRKNSGFGHFSRSDGCIPEKEHYQI